MEEEKEIKALLQQLAMEETNDDFTFSVMQRIEALETVQPHVVPLLRQRLIQVLSGVFASIVVALLVWCAFGQPIVFSFHFTLAIPTNYISQLVSFVVVFWLVMLVNLVYQWKTKQGLLS